jgi:hypothetical protein
MSLSKVKEFIYSFILIFVFVLVVVNLAIYTLENARSIQDVLPLIGLYLFTRIILPIIGLLMLAYTIRLYIDRHSNPYSLESIPTNQSQGREGGGAYTPTNNINENSSGVGERVKDYMNAANLSRFSVYDYPIVASIYKAIGYTPHGANKQIQNESFGKLLISTKFFEQEKTFIILKPLYHKTTENEANKYYSEQPKNAYLLNDVSMTYRSSNNEKIGQEVSQ